MRTSKSVFHNSINLPKKSCSSLNWARRICNPVFWLSKVGGRILKTILPYVFSGGYMAVFRKSVSFVNKIRFSMWASVKRWEFLTPLGAVDTWCPKVFNQRHSLRLTFSSAKNFMVMFAQEESLSCNQLRGVFQRCADIGFFERWEVFKNFINAFSGGEHFQNLPNHDTGAFKGRLSVADFRISNNEFVDLYFTHVNRITSLMGDVNIAV